MNILSGALLAAVAMAWVTAAGLANAAAGLTEQAADPSPDAAPVPRGQAPATAAPVTESSAPVGDLPDPYGSFRPGFRRFGPGPAGLGYPGWSGGDAPSWQDRPYRIPGRGYRGRARGYGYGYPGYRGLGGSPYPRHRQFGQPPGVPAPPRSPRTTDPPAALPDG